MLLPGETEADGAGLEHHAAPVASLRKKIVMARGIYLVLLISPGYTGRQKFWSESIIDCVGVDFASHYKSAVPLILQTFQVG